MAKADPVLDGTIALLIENEGPEEIVASMARYFERRGRRLEQQAMEAAYEHLTGRTIEPGGLN
jgi:hypothetical protein